jgi:hypothetical protein
MRAANITFHDVPDCIRLSNDEAELVVTTAFGPRVLYYGFGGDHNLFAVFDEEIAEWKSGMNDRGQWQSYGGHRLWHAPEVMPRTYAPDNTPVSHRVEDGRLILGPVREAANGLDKTIAVSLSHHNSHVEIDHQITNRGPWEVTLSAWCLSVMAPGGELLVPQEEYRPHPDCLTPARPIVIWHFTTMDDPRLEWGTNFIRMKQDDAYPTKLKFGTCNTKGWAAYRLGDLVFLKRYPFIESATYPDMGCNCEFYTQPGFLEIESLSPMTTLKPGETVEHREQWSLHRFPGDVPEEERDIVLERIVGSL